MHSIEVSLKGKWVAVPAVTVDGNLLAITGKRIRIAAVKDEEWLETELVDPERCISELKQEGYPIADVFTFMQKPPVAHPKYRYPLERVSVAVAQFRDFKTWWGKLPQETRKNVRRAEKRDVIIQVTPFGEELIRGIAEVQNETPVRQGRRYPHYGKTLEEVRRDHYGFVDRSDFITAHWHNEFVGFLKLVYRGQLASVLQLNAKMSHYDKRPSNALLAKAVQLCDAKRISFLTYGKFNYGNKAGCSLTEFKTRNGFQEVLVPRYYVPLTGLGAFYTKLGLYRGLLGILPGRVITAGLKARSAWYSLKTS